MTKVNSSFLTIPPTVNRVCFTYLCKLLMSFIDVHTKLFIWICPNARCQHKEAQNTTMRTATRTLQIALFGNVKSSFARVVRAFFIFVHFAAVLGQSSSLNHLVCSCVYDVSTWRNNTSFFLAISKPLILVSIQVYSKLSVLEYREMVTETKTFSEYVLAAVVAAIYKALYQQRREEISRIIETLHGS